MRRSISAAPPSRRKTIRISEADRALWETLVRDITPLHRGPAPPAAEAVALAPAAPPVASPVVAQVTPAAPRSSPPPPPLVVGERAPGLDGLGWASLTRRGAVVTRRRLDLHGRTVQAAYLALHDFLDRAWRDGVRHVEVITGLGSGLEGGAIRRELPHWLNAPSLRAIVLGAAHPHPRNPGSVRLLLRRRKTGSSPPA